MKDAGNEHLCIKVFKGKHILGSENAELSCLRDKEKGFVPVNTSLLSYPSAISCHNQLGVNQHTSTLAAQGKIALWLRGCTLAQEPWQNPFIILIFPHFFPCSFNAAF